MSKIKNLTIEEYCNTYGFNAVCYDESIDDYLFDEDLIDPSHEDWERVKDCVIVEYDEKSNDVLTLVIMTEEEEPEEEEKDWTEGLSKREIESIIASEKYMEEVEERRYSLD